MIRQLITIHVFIGMFTSPAVLATDTDVVTFDQITKWRVVIPDGAIPSEQYAAEEFISIFALASGVFLERDHIVPDSGGYIFIGQAQDDISMQDSGGEGLQIVIAPTHITLTGGRPRGVLYSVYEFFERYLGIHFLTADHTYIPHDIKHAEIPCESFNYTPPFRFRWSFFHETNQNQAFATRLRTNTIQTSPRFGGQCDYSLIDHSFHKHLPVGRYGDTHPEYFMFWKGRRAVGYRDTWGLGPNPCYASEGALDVIIDSTRAYFNEHPDQQNISLSCIDSYAHCQCDQCTQVNQQHGGTSGSHFAFINQVAKRMKNEYPNKFIGSLAYQHTRHPPTDMVLENNVQIQLASIECCTYHALDDPHCPKNTPFYRDLKAWSKICKNIMIWNYNVNFTRYDLPFANLKSIGPNVRLFRDNHVTGVFMQGAGNSRNSDFSDLKNWVISQCLWRPGASSWNLALKFCRMHYGESAGPIIEWLSLLHNHVALSQVHYNCFPESADMNLDVAMGIKALEQFEDALALAQSDEVYARVEKASICAYRLILDASPRVKVDGKYQVTLPEGYENILAKYQELTRKYKTDKPAERLEFEDLYAMIEIEQRR